MYRITSSVHIHFAHHVRGHGGPCISLHGHTWMFEVTLQAGQLDPQGFVADFDELGARVLEPCHRLLDHSLALGDQSYVENAAALAQLGNRLVASRIETLGSRGQRQAGVDGDFFGARNEWPGGIKVCVFPFAPTSERLAEWLHHAASRVFASQGVSVAQTRVYESLHPVPCFAEYLPTP